MEFRREYKLVATSQQKGTKTKKQQPDDEEAEDQPDDETAEEEDGDMTEEQKRESAFRKMIAKKRGGK